jgi:glycosyltransferase involved in cell wall biosynthesis
LFRDSRWLTKDRSTDVEIMRIRSVVLINLNLFRAASAFAPEIVYANDLNTLVAAHMLHAIHGVPIVYDAHEVYPEQFATRDRSETWHSFYTSLEKQLIGAALGRFTVCDSIGEYFAAAYGAPGFVTTLNTPSLKHLPPESILDRRNATPKLIYHGSYAAFRGLDEIVNAAVDIEGAQIVFRGIGDYETVLREHVERTGVGDKVRFEPPVAVTELVESASVCDIGLNPFVNVCKNSEFAMPNKFFEYMMAGLALMSSDLVEMRRLTDRLRVGRLFPDLSPRSVADSVNTLVADRDAIQTFRSNAYFAARNRYNWETEEQLFLQNFDRFMSPAL